MIDDWYIKNLACPRDHTPLHVRSGQLSCERGHSYHVVDGIPVMLVGDARQTIGIAKASLEYAERGPPTDGAADDLYLGSVGISDAEREGVLEQWEKKSRVDPAVAFLIGATNGIAYKSLIGKLDGYPIPVLPLAAGRNGLFLDLGCGWGRWCIAAARTGHQAVGIDPSLGAVMAARRVARDLKLDIRYVVGDARFLPFPEAKFRHVFSYSVIQHFPKEDVRQTMSEVSRVLERGGQCTIQMATTFGLRCLYHQLRRGFREARDFEVRYWTIPALRRLYRDTAGNSAILPECYFGIGLLDSDVELLRRHLRWVLRVSNGLKKLAACVPALAYLADSVYVRATKP